MQVNVKFKVIVVPLFEPPIDVKSQLGKSIKNCHEPSPGTNWFLRTSLACPLSRVLVPAAVALL